MNTARTLRPTPIIGWPGKTFAAAIGLPAEPGSILRGLLPSEPNRLATVAATNVPTDRGCSDEEHAAQRGEIPVQFKG